MPAELLYATLLDSFSQHHHSKQPSWQLRIPIFHICLGMLWSYHHDYVYEATATQYWHWHPIAVHASAASSEQQPVPTWKMVQPLVLAMLVA